VARKLRRSQRHLRQHVAQPELLALLQGYPFVSAYTPADGASDKRLLELGFGVFPLAQIEQVFAAPLGRAALAGLLDLYYTRHHFVLRVSESALFGGWDYAVTAERGAAEVQQQAPTLLDAWIAAEHLVQQLIAMKGKAQA
jgi:hypothetical protein